MMTLDIILNCIETMYIINARNLANVCHNINCFAVYVIVILAYIQEERELRKILFPILDETMANIIKFIFFELHFLFIIFTHICYVHREYENNVPVMFQKKYVKFPHQCLAMVTTCYFILLTYFVFKWGKMFRCNFLLTKLNMIFIAYYNYNDIMDVYTPEQQHQYE